MIRFMTDRYVNWPPPHEALVPLIEELARISARASHEMGVTFDMDDPEVAREIMRMTFEAVFLSSPETRRRCRFRSTHVDPMGREGA